MTKVSYWPVYLGPDLNQEFSLQRMFFVLDKLGNPHLKLKNVIHITGTKGKGSVSVYIASILQKCGYKTALYISPHIYELNERIQINSNFISDDDFFIYTEKIRRIAEDYNIDKISSFEAITLAAFSYFADNSCDFHVIEVGMGGLFDATNVFEKNSPIAAVFMPIHLDHKIFLGDKIENIVGHKLGILHTGIQNIIVSSQSEGVLGIIKNYVKLINQINKKENKKKLAGYYYDEDFFSSKIELEGNEISTKERQNIEDNYFIFQSNLIENELMLTKPLLFGEYQMVNFSVAIQTILAITNSSFNNLKDLINENLFDSLNIKHVARMELVLYSNLITLFNDKSLFFMDGAHNQISAFALNKEIKRIKDENHLEKVFVFMARSKGSGDEMIKVLDNKIIDKLFCIRANLEARSEAPEVIYEIAKKYEFNTGYYQNLKLAIEDLKDRNEDENKPCLFIFTGSLYLARDIKYFYKD